MKLNKQNYYSQQADQKYMSYSQFKDFDKCPAYAMAKIKGEWKDEESDALLVGSYVDAWLDDFMNGMDQFVISKAEHPQIYTQKGELKANFKLADDICNIIQKDEYLYNQLKGKRQQIITGNIAGVQFKGKIDSLLDDAIIDGKVLKDCADVWLDGKKQPFYMANRYDIQAAIYQTIYKQMTGKKLPFRLAVVTKEKVPDKRIFEFSDQTIEDALQEIIAKAPVYQAIKEGKEPSWNCGQCEYCRSIKALNKNSVEVL